MSQPFAVFDIDGTVIRWQLYHAIVNELANRGKLPETAREHIRDSRMVWKKREHDGSFKDYEHTLVKQYHQALTNLSTDDYLQAVDHVFETYKDQVYTYTRDLIKRLKAEGYLLLTISGSQQEIIGKLADYYGFDHAVGARYEQVNGRFTGAYQTAVHDKGIALDALIAERKLSLKDSIAVGDSESDISLLSRVERPIAFNPNKGLFDEARKRGWNVVLERKNMIYELEKRGGSYVLA